MPSDVDVAGQEDQSAARCRRAVREPRGERLLQQRLLLRPRRAMRPLIARLVDRRDLEIAEVRLADRKH
jgi:hypothetical protein